MSTHKTIKSLMLSLEKKLKVTTEEVFMEKITNISKKITTTMNISKSIMKQYLMSHAGMSKFPKIRTGNLVDKLTQGNINPTPIITRQGTIIKATFSGWYGVDAADESGVSHTVLRTSGKNSPAPYAYFLNTMSKYKKYNGFFNTALVQYNKTITKQFDTMINKELGSYRLKLPTR